MSKNIVHTNPHFLRNQRLYANFIIYLDDKDRTEDSKSNSNSKVELEQVKPLSIYTGFFDSRDPNKYKEKMFVLLEREIMRQHLMKKLFPFCDLHLA